MPTPDGRPVLAIAGATGFVGRSLRQALAGRYHIVGLTRSAAKVRNAEPDDPVEWRRCDLFSLLHVERALEGVDYAVYLVHSMLPSARLTQAHFADLDLIMADNFARAAADHGVQQILYIGGLIPDDEDDLSPHLASRLEVERTLGSGPVPLTALRAGLIVGPGGSSLRMLVNLVRRLPAMILPEWTQSMTQPIALDDVVRAVMHVVGNTDFYDGHFDVGGPNVMSYQEMMEQAAGVLEVHRPMLNVPVFTPKLSRLWVSVVTGAPRALAGPLIESLKHDMVVQDNPLQAWLEHQGTTDFLDAVRHAIDREGRVRPNPRSSLRPVDDAAIREARQVRSVQRMPLPDDHDATWAAYEYMRWLPTFIKPFLRGTVSDDGVCRVYLRPLPWPLLELSFSEQRSDPDRPLFYITGGMLADTSSETGRLEFREVLDGTVLLAAIHDFRPRLPWYLYNSTQALAHLWVMRGFRHHLLNLATQAEREEAALTEAA